MRIPKGREAGAARSRAVPALSRSVCPTLGSESRTFTEKKDKIRSYGQVCEPQREYGKGH